MCGIAGFIDPENGYSHGRQRVEDMCHVIRHRGPDEQGVWADGEVALGMRRLSIIDVSGGQQPIFNEDQSVLVVFNGEIYNYRELKGELERRGHHFSTNSDTETIVHAYEEYGDDCVKHLRGMFVFALWDRKRQRMLLARDRFGKKPLNYYWDGRRLIFGSEIKSLLEAGVPREIDTTALDEYLLYNYVPTPLTFFKNVKKLPGAHILVYEQGKIRVERYWDLSFEPTCTDDEATAIERIRTLLEDAVRCRLMSEVPLGAFLSGGVDSSIVVGLMSKMMDQPVKTFSIGFEEDDYSELPYARLVAQHFGTDHHEFIVRPDLVSVLPDLIWAYDEPFADASMVPTYYVSKMAREHVTVALTGDGGDEIFGGYWRYGYHASVQQIPGLIREMAGFVSKMMPHGMRGKSRLNVAGDLAGRYVGRTIFFREDLLSSIYDPEYLAHRSEHNPFTTQLREFEAVAHLDSLAQMQHVDVRTYLPDDILVKVDKASMINSLETRTPLLDQHLTEYVASLPSKLRTPDTQLKYLLKKIAAEILPAEIITRPKHGFSLPVQKWLRNDLKPYVNDVLNPDRIRKRGIFQPAFVRHLLDSHNGSGLRNHERAIWTLLCLEVWFQVYMDEPATRPRERHASNQPV